MRADQRLLAQFRAAGRAEAAKLLKAKIGYVTSYDPQLYAVRVRLEPESTANESRGMKAVETNWIPIYRPYGGNSWGLITPPNANPSKPYGDQCLILWPDDGHGVALVGFFNAQEQPFTGPANGEFWFKTKSGSILKALNNGAMQLKSSTGSEFLLDANGDVYAFNADGSKMELAGTDFKLTSAGGAVIRGSGAQVFIN